MACRMPAIPNPAALWALLRDGAEAIPGLRGDGVAEDPGGFGADLFDIPPREAAATDPQQGLALELSWEGLEDAGIVVHRSSRGPVGVFLGVMSSDYADVVVPGGERAITRHSLTGLGRSIIANRISH